MQHIRLLEFLYESLHSSDRTCYPKSLLLFRNASFENQLASLLDSITVVES